MMNMSCHGKDMAMSWACHGHSTDVGASDSALAMGTEGMAVRVCVCVCVCRRHFLQ